MSNDIFDTLLGFAERRDANPADDDAAVELNGAVDVISRRIDERVAAVLDAVLHAPAFQALEAAWRGLYHLVSGIRPNDRTLVTLWSLTKEELAEDLAETSTNTQTFAILYTAEYGQFGGQPYGAALCNFEVTTSPSDITLLRALSKIAAMAHVGVFLSPSPRLVGIDRWEDLCDASDVHDGAAFVAWRSLRDEEDSRYIGLVLPRELGRCPYDTADGLLGYVETIEASGDGLLWASPIYSLGRRLSRVFGRTGMLGTLIGEDIDSPPPMAAPHSLTLGDAWRKPSLEATITPRLERQLRHLGLIAIQQAGNRLVVPSAHSLAQPKDFGRSHKGREATINHLLGTRFPYLLIACRFAHYLKVIEREAVGRNSSAKDIERVLDAWLNRYVVNQDGASLEIRAAHPLREARVKVWDIPGVAGSFEGQVLLRPHIRYLGLLLALDVRLPDVNHVAAPTDGATRRLGPSGPVSPQALIDPN